MNPPVASHARHVRRGTAFVIALSLARATLAQTPVDVVPAEAAAIDEELQLSGTLTPQMSARLSPRVDGLVQSLRVDAGDRVERGAVLLELDATLAEAALRRARALRSQAEATRDEARRRADEARRLVPERHLPQTELDARLATLAEAEAGVAVADAAAREQDELVRRHALIAPFDGVITVRSTDVGEWVARGDGVLELVSLDDVRLDVQAPQERFTELTPDTPVQLLPDASPGTTLPGRIAARVPVGGGAGARTFLVRVLPDDSDARLFPGTSASARFRLRSDVVGAVQVPRDALLRHPDGGYSLFVVADANGALVAQRRNVRLGRDDGERVQILEGVSAGERVVVRGNEVLSDGEAVRIAPSSP